MQALPSEYYCKFVTSLDEKKNDEFAVDLLAGNLAYFFQALRAHYIDSVFT
jgi:hypothetical protein